VAGGGIGGTVARAGAGGSQSIIVVVQRVWLAFAGGTVGAVVAVTPASVALAGAGVGVIGQAVPMSTAGNQGGGSAPSSVRGVLDGLPGTFGKSGPIKKVPDEQALDDLFNALSRGGKTIDPGTYPGIVKELPDGSIVRMRPSSRSGGATIDVTLPDGSIYKVHVGS
jgi:hypothetical protein